MPNTSSTSHNTYRGTRTCYIIWFMNYWKRSVCFLQTTFYTRANNDLIDYYSRLLTERIDIFYDTSFCLVVSFKHCCWPAVPAVRIVVYGCCTTQYRYPPTNEILIKIGCHYILIVCGSWSDERFYHSYNKINWFRFNILSLFSISDSFRRCSRMGRRFNNIPIII